jgi:cell division protein FtsL
MPNFIDGLVFELMRSSILILFLIFCCAIYAFARGGVKRKLTHVYADTVLVKDSAKTTTTNKKINKKSLSHSRMSQVTRNRIAKIEALNKKIDKIEANIKRREAEIAKVEARQ